MIFFVLLARRTHETLRELKTKENIVGGLSLGRREVKKVKKNFSFTVKALRLRVSVCVGEHKTCLGREGILLCSADTNIKRSPHLICLSSPHVPSFAMHFTIFSLEEDR